jgi:arabinose-5-phosphate isomerase
VTKRVNVAAEIKRVLDLEAKALKLASAAVNPSFSKAVDLMLRCKGKVILTGVGKSGLVAQKTAATLSSTGTPALFIAPTDAQHGGLGAIQKNDLVIAIGKSGESDELNSLFPALRSIGAKLIAITANDKSTLAKAAEYVLLTPITEEACPLNLAPTCSTTAALAVGDALAVALMKLRNFKAEHFAANHPAGRLGRRLNLTVGDIMRSGEENPVVHVDDTVATMLVEITRKHAGAASVVDGKGRFAGLVTDFDIRRMLEKSHGDFRKLSIRKIMNPKPATVFADEPAQKAVEIMENRAHPFNVLPVVDRKRRPVGLVQVHDLRARGL